MRIKVLEIEVVKMDKNLAKQVPVRQYAEADWTPIATFRLATNEDFASEWVLFETPRNGLARVPRGVWQSGYMKLWGDVDALERVYLK